MIEDAIKLIDLGETAEDDRTAEVIATITPVSRDETFQASQQKMKARYWRSGRRNTTGRTRSSGTIKSIRFIVLTARRTPAG